VCILHIFQIYFIRVNCIDLQLGACLLILYFRFSISQISNEYLVYVFIDKHLGTVITIHDILEVKH